jgi:hypothetical protein
MILKYINDGLLDSWWGTPRVGSEVGGGGVCSIKYHLPSLQMVHILFDQGDEGGQWGKGRRWKGCDLLDVY